MFRAFAAYLVLSRVPNGHEMVLQLLGNKDEKVLREAYAFLAERKLASSAQQAILSCRFEADRKSR